MKTGFSSGFLARLNRLYDAGVFLKAAIVSRGSDAGKDYFVHYGEPVTFRGHVYQPLPMEWDGVEATSTMQLPGVRISVANIQGQAEQYVDDADILGTDVVLQIMHLDLLNNPKDADEVALQIQSIEITAASVSIMCGLNLGLQDSLPKGIITRSEFPGNSDDIRRYTIV